MPVGITSGPPDSLSKITGWDFGTNTMSWTVVPLDLDDGPAATEISRKVLKDMEEQMMRAMMTGTFDPHPGGDTYRVSYDITLRELFTSRRTMDDLLRATLDRCSVMLADKVAERIVHGDFDRLIDGAIKDAVRAEATKAAKSRIEEVLEEAFGE